MAAKRGILKTLTRYVSPEKNMYHYQLGLMSDDLIRDRYPEVREAISRMPKELQDARLARHTRALYYDAKKSILPEDEWMTREKDIHYLKPYLEEVGKEMQEKKEWEANAVQWKQRSYGDSSGFNSLLRLFRLK